MRGRGVIFALLALAGADAAAAQDSLAIRHLLALDVARLTPFHRAYDIVVHRGDTTTVIGGRLVRLESALYAGAPAWLLTESRTGTVVASESLYVAPDGRPVHWASTVGPARLAVAFVGDSMLGATTVGGFKQNLVVRGQPDLLVSASMLELALGLLPLGDAWRDSAAVLHLAPTARAVTPVELLVLGAERVLLDSIVARNSHVVAVRAEDRSILYWVDAATGAVLRMQQRLPAHVGSVLEYRFRSDVVTP